MSDTANTKQTDTSSSDQTAAPAEWKPEPREWTWQDIFKAPMIALKLRCMLISVATIFALVLVSKIFDSISADVYLIKVVGPLLTALKCLVFGAVFGIGGTFVAIFIKSELLEDDYPIVKEAIAQFKQRIFPAIMVPIFLLLALKAIFFGGYVWELACSIPFVGSALYFGSIPLYLIMFLYTLFGIGVVLSFFVFPAIVAIRKHGWFDNVIDTLEAVGTKPHKVIASIVVTVALITICFSVGLTGLYHVKTLSNSSHLYSDEIQDTEKAANYILNSTLPAIIPQIFFAVSDKTLVSHQPEPVDSFYHQWITGLAVGIFQTILVYLIAGYGFNILITGGMLSYLHVREDDYWDDEDLADLDKLAKELEEEAANAQGSDNTPAAADGATDTDTDEVVDTKAETDELPAVEVEDADEDTDESTNESADTVEKTEDQASEDSSEGDDSADTEANSNEDAETKNTEETADTASEDNDDGDSEKSSDTDTADGDDKK